MSLWSHGVVKCVLILEGLSQTLLILKLSQKTNSYSYYNVWNYTFNKHSSDCYKITVISSPLILYVYLVAGLTAPPGSALNKTPERIEYYTESEVEESEMEQTAHNLSGSLLSLEVGDSDSDE